MTFCVKVTQCALCVCVCVCVCVFVRCLCLCTPQLRLRHPVMAQAAGVLVVLPVALSFGAALLLKDSKANEKSCWVRSLA